MMQSFPSLPALIDAQKPQALLVDLWGVIHDGEALYPGVKEALDDLRQRKIKVVFLSNAPRRASVAEANLRRLGITPDYYTGLITSGETTFHYLSAADAPWGSHYLYIGPQKDHGLLDGLPYTEVTEAKAASFAVCTGLDNDDSTLEEKLPQLKAAFLARLPLVCANPDMEVVRINGSRALCAGVLAQWYEDQGGNVYYFGKPYKNIYDLSLATYNLQPATTLAIGDNLYTDIKGANHYGIRSVLVTGGVLQEQLDQGQKIEDVCNAGGHIPQFLIASFR